MIRLVEVNCWSENSRSDHVIEVREVKSLARSGKRGHYREQPIDGDGDVKVREMKFFNPWRHW